MLRIAVVSDIHGNLPALEAVSADIARRGVDTVVNLGDSLSGPLMPLETAQYLMARDWLHLAGNHERQLLSEDPGEREELDTFARKRLGLSEMEWLQSLPTSMQLIPEVLLCHGTPERDTEYFLETVDTDGIRAADLGEIEARLGKVSAELIVCGHTHIARSVRTGAGQLIVNPGSVGLQAYRDNHPYPHLVGSNSPDARYAIVERNHGQWTSMLLSIPYAHDAMAHLAQQNGRDDWGLALKTGSL